MPQPNITIQDSISSQQTGRLWFNKNEWHTWRFFGTTTDGTATELFIDGVSGARLKLPEDSVSTMLFLWSAWNATGSKAGGGMLGSCIKNIAGTLTEVAAEQAVMTTVTDTTPAFVVPAIAADSVNDAVTVTVTGTAATTIYWEVMLIGMTCVTSPESNFGRLA